MPDALIRLILADDHPIVLEGLQQLFERHNEFVVVGAYTTGAGALAAARRQDADVMVLDMRMPDTSGLEVLRSVSAEHLTCRVVVLTAALPDAEAADVIRLGAKGLVLKDSPPESLIECVRHVARGDQWIDRATLTKAFDHVVREGTADRSARAVLTTRELEVVRMIAKGLRNKEIATRLFISEGTVKIHLHNAYEKLGVDGRLELLVYAKDKGLV